MLNYEWLRAHQKQVLLLLLAVVVLIVLQVYSDVQDNRLYVKEGKQLVAIQREDIHAELSVPLTIEVGEEGSKQTYEVTLSFSGATTDDGEVAISEAEVDTLGTAIERLVSTLEEQDGLTITLPETLSDGTKLTWKAPSGGQGILLILLFPLGIFYLYRSEREEIRKQQLRKSESIRRALPTFNDQVLLLMNSGLIFHDAFLRIAENYEGRNTLDDFGKIVLEIAKKVKNSGKSIISVMEESKKEIALREYSRMVNILSDNQIKGVDLKEKLESESRLLWESRKALSLQKGKEIETKLTFPLAILLLVVVIITGVPAMMTM